MLEPYVYEWIEKRKGSISAEHGLGLAKKPYIKYSRNETMVGLMKQIKNLYDPVSAAPPTRVLLCFYPWPHMSCSLANATSSLWPVRRADRGVCVHRTAS